jgi:hypothetical protein
MSAGPGTRRIAKAARSAALGLALLTLVTLAIVSIAQIYEVIFTVLLSFKDFKNAVLIGALLSATIPAGYMVANTFALFGIAVRGFCAIANKLRE